MAMVEGPAAGAALDALGEAHASAIPTSSSAPAAALAHYRRAADGTTSTTERSDLLLQAGRLFVLDPQR